ncbi:MAG: hypothetical protein HC939_09550, partial [Pleurocapsa sp. SU_5_0]|nr:hypothetical protein [Pleurocapsa sp. SU_5_0]
KTANDKLESILRDGFSDRLHRMTSTFYFRPIEAFEGQYTEKELLLKIKPEEIKEQALLLIA